MQEFTPLDIQVQNDDDQVLIKWADDHTSTLPILRLRGYCPCADCQGHGGNIKWIETSVGGIKSADAVGRYAINFVFDDDHATGIYTWKYLRRLDPEEAERWGEPESFNLNRA